MIEKKNEKFNNDIIKNLDESFIKTKEDDGKAIALVNYDINKGGFYINEEAISIVSSIKEEIGIISVAGMYRTGKSYLLNRMLLNRSNGFSVGPSINPCTKGLWIWNKPILCHTPEGKPIKTFIFFL